MQLPSDEDSERSRDSASMSTHSDELSLHLWGLGLDGLTLEAEMFKVGGRGGANATAF